MGFSLVFIAVILAWTAAKGHPKDLAELVASDFKVDGDNPGFGQWALAIFLVGAIGFYQPFRGFSRALLGLVAVSILVANRGLFTKFQEQTTPQEGGADGSKPEGVNLGGQVLQLKDFLK